MSEGLEKSNINTDDKPEFSTWAPILKSEEIATIKRTLFEQTPTESTTKEGGHGIDLLASNFMEVDANGNIVSGPDWFKENPLDEFEPRKAVLEYGKSYYALIEPVLQTPYIWSKYIFYILPKSTLHRVGIAACESPFYGTEDEYQKNQLGITSEAYEDGRQAAIKILVLNPNGVEVEEFAPFVQMVIERLPEKKAKESVTEQNRFAAERWPEKREPLHLGAVSEFLPQKPRITKDPQKSIIDVTKPIKPDEEIYRVRKNTPYVIHTKESLVVSPGETGVTRAFPEEEKPIRTFGDALVDAGYHGKLTFLIMPKEDLTLRIGDPIGYFSRIHVPPTDKSYQGRYQEKKNNLPEK